MKLLGQKMHVFLILVDTVKLLSKMAVPFVLLLVEYETTCFPTLSPTLGITR